MTLWSDPESDPMLDIKAFQQAMRGSNPNWVWVDEINEFQRQTVRTNRISVMDDRDLRGRGDRYTKTGGPFYGFSPDLCEPPNGGYSFIEFDDLPSSARIEMAFTSLGQSAQVLNKRMHEFRDSVGKAVSTCNSVGELTVAMKALVVAAEYLEAKELHERYANEKQLKDAAIAEVNKVTAAGGNYLRAMNREIEQIQKKLAAGEQGVRYRTSRPLPPWTCVWAQGGEATPVIPGQVLNAITSCEPWIIESTSSKVLGVRTTYGTRVFRKE